MDSGTHTGTFPGYTLAQLKQMVESNSASINSMPDLKAGMIEEIARREAHNAKVALIDEADILETMRFYACTKAMAVKIILNQDAKRDAE